MFSWGEDCQQGFRARDCSGVSAGDGVHRLNLRFHIAELAAGRSALAFVKSNGDAFIISKDEKGVKGKQKYVKYKEKIQAVCCGDDTVTLLSETGQVLSVDTAHTPFIPRPVDALCNIPVSQVACGSQHSVVLTKDGQVYTWGQDSRGQLGLGKRKLWADSPQHLGSLSGLPVVHISAGGEQSFTLSVSGAVFAWGGNACGQLGLGDTTDRHTPISVHHLNMRKTVCISSGKDHTAILTKDGAVFTFGSGQYGQLGHNSFSNELRPRLVAELWGAKVTKIACGSHHTLVLTDSKRVYSFGCGEQGQLGRGEESQPSVPLSVQLPRDSTTGPIVRSIYAGGNCSFATCTSVQDVHAESNTDMVNCMDEMIDKWTSKYDSKSWKTIKQEIQGLFSSASSVNRCFLDRRKDKHFQTSPKYSGLDLSLAQTAFQKLAKNDKVMTEVEAAVLRLLPSLDESPVGVEGLRIYLLLNELLHVIQTHKLSQSTELADMVAVATQGLSAESLQVLGDWWSSLYPSTMVRHVKVWKQALTVTLSSEPVPCKSRVICKVLQYMYNANNRIAGRQRIPETVFGLGFSKEYLEKDLQRWSLMPKTQDMHYQPLILHDFPFEMDLKSKKMAFDINAECDQGSHTDWTLEQWKRVVWSDETRLTLFQSDGCIRKERAATPRMVFNPLYGWFPEQNPFRFELRLKRASLLEDTFTQLSDAHPTDFKKALRVYFDEDPTVTNVYKRDFFHHSFREMMSPTFGMFMFNESQTLAWFPSDATGIDRRFFLLGVMCGLALYNQNTIYLPFPLALFKKLLDVEPTLEDMRDFDGYGKILQDVLDYNDDDLEDLDMSFAINWRGTEVDLDPQNPGKPVTGQNKKEFVDAYVNHVFNTSVQRVFKEFRRGFFLVCDRDLVKQFSPEELRGVLVGREVFNWAKLRRNTVYEWGYCGDDPNIQMFWEVFDELTEDQKKDFILFLTGERRVPILGMDHIRMRVQVHQAEPCLHDQHKPESLTCHSILYLPFYSTKEIMQERLAEAVIPDGGFQE